MADRHQDFTATAFLRQLADPQRSDIDARKIAIVVAHPDDETYGCGAALARLHGMTLVHVTDGAPRNGVDARANGFSGWEAYAEARRVELDVALALAGAQSIFRLCLGLPDQEAYLHLTEIVRALAGLFDERKIATVLTHAFEGGHPDHDAVAFAVAHVARDMEIVEMPYYRLGPSGQLSQDFLDVNGAGEEHRIHLTTAEKKRKRRMITAYKTQIEPLSQVSTEFETFRLAPHYDFSAKPNEGKILYEEIFDWGISAERVRDHFVAAREALVQT
jgi:LmbE family N-acetylglucosaminyl deacetylase